MSDKYLETAINDLAEQYTPEVVVTEVKRLLGAAIPSTPNRGPATARAAGERQRTGDVSRFSMQSLKGRLLSKFDIAYEAGLTAFQAAEMVIGKYGPLTQFEGCRRRVSDLVKAGYVADSGRRRTNPGTSDESVAWTITPLGVSALEAIRTTGWTRPAVKAAA